MKLLTTLGFVGATLIPTTVFADWSGFYIGGSLGTMTNGTLGFSDGFERGIEEASPFGLFLGYQAQNGQIVFGGEYAVALDADIGLEDFESPDEVVYAEGDLKARVGYDFGNILGYGVASFSTVAIADPDNEVVASGFGIGFGADFQLDQNFIVGAELLFRELNGEYENEGVLADDDVDVSTTTLSLRASYKF
ncbi:MAG: outer membrane beta-barrel protein [Pseudomonadota bacterium]